MTPDSPRHITLGQFTTVFVPMALLLTWALLQPEMGTGDLETGRTRLTMWASTILLIPALGLYPFRSLGQTVANLSHLFWTAALAVFLVHTYWGAFIFYHGVADTFQGQGTPLASANFTLLTFWVVDVALLWIVRDNRYVSIFHTVVRLAVFALFSLDLTVGRSGGAQKLGFIFLGVLLVAGLIRFATTRVQVSEDGAHS